MWFGVGTFGVPPDEDPIQGLGNCYRMVIRDTNCEGGLEGGAPLERNVLAQVQRKNILRCQSGTISTG